jgi:hypothetical protein
MQEGQTIKHDQYGLGIVTASDPERTAIDFDDTAAKATKKAAAAAAAATAK